MAIKNITPLNIGNVGNNPTQFMIDTDNTLAEIIVAGFLNEANGAPYSFQEGDYAAVKTTNSGTQLCQITLSGDDISFAPFDIATVTLEGTDHQVIVTQTSPGVWKLETPQDIDTTSSVVFNGLTLNDLGGESYASIVSVSTDGGIGVVTPSDSTPRYLSNAGLTNAPKWDRVDMASSGITGILPIANGGTNSDTTLENGFLMTSVGGKIVEIGGDISANNFRISDLGNPSQPGDAANKTYVDDLIQGLTYKAACTAATTEALPANTYNNGTAGIGATLTANTNGSINPLDGVTLIVGNRVLVKNEVTQSHNGIYLVTQVGSVSLPWILTRAPDFNQASEIPIGATTFIAEGDENEGTTWAQTSLVTTVGSDAITFVQVGGAAAVNIVGTANEISVNQVGNTFTLSTPQPIGMASTPTFTNVELTALTYNTLASIGPSGTFVSVSYTAASTASTVAYRDASGDFGMHKLTLDGNLAFSGSTLRITGDFSNSTLASRVMFQTSTLNSSTNVGIIPEGSNAVSTLNVYNAADPTNSSFLQFRISGSSAVINSNVAGTGTQMPLSISIASTPAITISTSRQINIPDLTASTAVVLDSSKNLTSLAYSTTNTASTLAERDSSGGLVASYFGSATANLATTGVLRLATTESVVWRNLANNADLALSKDTNNVFNFPTQLTLGTSTSVGGTLGLYGSTSGMVTIQTDTAAGSYNFNLPTTAGTSGDLLTSAGGGLSAMTWTTVSSTPSANGIVRYTANSDILANEFVAGITSTASSGGTTTLTVASTQVQRITGSTTHTLQLPDATTLAVGTRFEIINGSTGTLTLKTGAGVTFLTIPGGGAVQCIYADVSTVAGTISNRILGATSNGGDSWGTAGINLVGTLTSAGVIAAYHESTATNAPSSGLLRLLTTETVTWRNNANSADLSLSKSTLDVLTWGGSLFSSPNYAVGFTTTTTSAGTTTLTSSSNQLQEFTGSSNHTVVLPNATTLPVGAQFQIRKITSAGTITLNDAASGLVASMTAVIDVIWLVLTDNSTSAGVWNINLRASSANNPGTIVVRESSGSRITAGGFVVSGSGATAGQIRLNSSDTIQWRNNAGSANVSFSKNSSDVFNLPTQLTVGSASGTTGTFGLIGTTSGQVTIQPQAAAGTYNFNLPTGAGTSGQILTSGGGGSTAMTWSSILAAFPIFIQTVADNTYVIQAYAPFAGTINGCGEIARALTTAGTFAIKINGTNVTGLTAVAPSTAGSFTSASGANTFALGDKIQIAYTGTTAVLDHSVTINVTRTS